MIEGITTFTIVASLLFLGWQSFEISRQTKLSNRLAGTESMNATLALLHGVLAHVVSEPELCQYFYDGVSLPSDSILASKVKVIAEMYTDAIEQALDTEIMIDDFKKISQ